MPVRMSKEPSWNSRRGTAVVEQFSCIVINKVSAYKYEKSPELSGVK